MLFSQWEFWFCEAHLKEDFFAAAVEKKYVREIF